MASPGRPLLCRPSVRPKPIAIVATVALLLLLLLNILAFHLSGRTVFPRPAPVFVLRDHLPDGIPPWLRDYVDWHRQPDTPDDQYVVWFCDTGRLGGIGDRVRGLVSAFYLAVALGRKFRIVNGHPIELWTVLRPAYIDWAKDDIALLADGDVTLSWINSVSGELSRVADGQYDRYRILVIRTNCAFWDTILNGPEFAHRLRSRKITSGDWPKGHDELLFAWAWALLMQPSEALRDDLHHLRTHLAPARYVAVHIRRGGHWLDGARHSDLKPFVDCLRNVTDVVGPLPVYIATDDAPSRAAFAALAAPLAVQYDDAAPFHVAQSGRHQLARRNLRTWAEFYVVMQAACVVGSRSGFSEWAVAGSRDLRLGARCQARFDRCAVELVRRSVRELVPAL